MTKPKPISERERGRQQAIRTLIVTMASLLPAEEMMAIMKGVSRTGRTAEAKRSGEIMDTVFAVIQLESDLMARGCVMKPGSLRSLIQHIGETMPDELKKKYKAAAKRKKVT